MEEEKREGQKTVVAFIAGIIIGALLMYVFGATPKKDAPSDVKTDDTAGDDVAAKVDTKVDTSKTPNDTKTAEISVSKTEVVAGVGSIAVANQKAGTKVMLGDIKYPANAGWIAVQNVNGDVLGTTLGAARFNVKDGLLVKEVSLMTPTVAGKEYKVVFHIDDGKQGYASKTDVVVNGADGKALASSFKAE